MDKKSIAKAVFLPGIFPLIKSLLLKTEQITIILALLLQSSRLITKTSPAVRHYHETGHIKLTHVLTDAWQNIKQYKYATDKLAVYAAILLGIFILIAQTVMLLLSASMSSAQASSLFTPTSSNPSDDVVLNFLDQIFGPDLGIFGSGAVSVGNTPIHNGFHDMLAFFSTATMTIAVIIIIYNIITIVGEAAITGAPFGRRFNSLWAPIRLVVALGLLVPLANGLNSAQYITLYIAKVASGMASVAWETFSTEATNPGRVFVAASPPTTEYLVKNVLLNEFCMYATNTIQAQADATTPKNQPISLFEEIGGTSRNIMNAQGAVSFTSSPDLYAEGQLISPRDDYIHFVWGENDGDTIPNRDCGEISLKISPRHYSMSDGTSLDIEEISHIQVAYLDEIKQIRAEVAAIAPILYDYYVDFGNSVPMAARPSPVSAVEQALRNVVNDSQLRLNTKFTTLMNEVANNNRDQIFLDMTEKGWGGASNWYMRIGQINRQVVEAANNAPEITVGIERSAGSSYSLGARAWDVTWRDGWLGDGSIADELYGVVTAIDEMFRANVSVDSSLITDNHFTPDTVCDIGFEVDDVFKCVMGIQALYAFHESTAANMDPMVGLQTIGQEMIRRADWFLKGLVGVAGANAIAGAFSQVPILGGISTSTAALLSIVEPFLWAGLFIGLGIGILLAYILPLMPFIYFFFAIASWAMEIMEALVAMPLWALSHLKIDGDGLPGSLAGNGYFLLLGILLRPILIVFGLIAGQIIFGAGAQLLHSLFSPLVSNLNEGQNLDAFGNFVYVSIFAYLCYQLAMLCFKLVDTIPQGILRWIGQGGATPFSDNKQDMGMSAAGAIFAGASAANMLRFSVSDSGRAIGSAAGQGARAGAGGISRAGRRIMRGRPDKKDGSTLE